MREPLAFYLNQEYSYLVIPDHQDGGYVIRFPDLPGCITQVDDPSEIASMAEEIKEQWIESEYGHGEEIPLPAGGDDDSGKFVVRLPRSLHRSMVEAAEREGVSLNAYVASVLARLDAQRRVERRLEAIEAAVAGSAERVAVAS